PHHVHARVSQAGAEGDGQVPLPAADDRQVGGGRAPAEAEHTSMLSGTTHRRQPKELWRRCAKPSPLPWSGVPGILRATGMSPQHLFTPFRLGHVTLRNRIVSTPHATRFGKDGYITERYIRYHQEKARGGAGLIQCFGSASVHPSSPVLDWNGIKN